MNALNGLSEIPISDNVSTPNVHDPSVVAEIIHITGKISDAAIAVYPKYLSSGNPMSAPYSIVVMSVSIFLHRNSIISSAAFGEMMADGISDRTSLLIGEEGVRILKDSFVVVAGAGAVGGYVLEGLVRAGVGHIRVVDSDVFSESNLNRQILATKDTIGRKKAEVAAERARSINPEIDIEIMPVMVSSDTVPDILSGNPDALADAIDTVEHKVSLLKYAAEKRIRTFSSMGAALHFETSSIRVATLKRTNTCPLASSVRSRLKDLDTGCIICVYSEEPVLVKPSERDDHGKSILGSLPTVPAVFGMTLANEIIRYLLTKE